MKTRGGHKPLKHPALTPEQARENDILHLEKYHGKVPDVIRQMSDAGRSRLHQQAHEAEAKVQ